MSQQYHPAIDRLIEHGYEFKHNRYIQNGFEMFKKNIGGFVGFTAAFYAIVFVITFTTGGFGEISGTPFVANIGSILINLIQPIFLAGILLVANDIMKGNAPEFGKFFEGTKFWGQLIILSLVIGLLTFVGLVFLIIPGIYLAVGYSFANMFVVFLGYDFWTAMELSRKIITKNWWPFLGFLFVLGLINLGGILACGIGIIFTIPATMCMTYCAFEDIVGGAIREHEAQFPPQKPEGEEGNMQTSHEPTQESVQDNAPVVKDLNETDYPKES